MHRIGRTGRAGMLGEAISLVSADEVDLLSDIERLTKTLLAREEIEDFEPVQRLPETTLARRVSVAKPRKLLNNESFKRDNSRSNPKKKRASAYGHGPTPGAKRKNTRRSDSSDAQGDASSSNRNVNSRGKTSGSVEAKSHRVTSAPVARSKPPKPANSPYGKNSQQRRRDA